MWAISSRPIINGRRKGALKRVALEDWAKAELEVESSYVDLFGIDNSQSQDDPLSPPPRHRKRCLGERHEVDDEYANSSDDNGGKGKQGGGYGGSGGGGGKRKRGF